MSKILIFSGSARKDSFNKSLAHLAHQKLQAQGVEATFVDLKDYPMPLYDGDLEDETGVPENALKLKHLFKAHDAFLITSPEYNSSISPLLKNTIDWVSRPSEGEGALTAFRGKTVALVAASPGPMGGFRGLIALRSILSSIGMIVLPDQLAIPSAHQCISEDQLTDKSIEERFEIILTKLVDITQKIY